MRSKAYGILLLATVLTASSALPIAASETLAQAKTFTSIECPDGGNAVIMGINNAGQVAGYCYFGSNPFADDAVSYGFLRERVTVHQPTQD